MLVDSIKKSTSKDGHGVGRSRVKTCGRQNISEDRVVLLGHFSGASEADWSHLGRTRLWVMLRIKWCFEINLVELLHTLGKRRVHPRVTKGQDDQLPRTEPFPWS